MNHSVKFTIKKQNKEIMHEFIFLSDYYECVSGHTDVEQRVTGHYRADHQGYVSGHTQLTIRNAYLVIQALSDVSFFQDWRKERAEKNKTIGDATVCKNSSLREQGFYESGAHVQHSGQMFSYGRRGLSSTSRDSYVTPVNGMEDVIVRPFTPSVANSRASSASQDGGEYLKPSQGQIPRLDLDLASEAEGATRPTLFHFNENKFASRPKETNGTSPQEKVIIDVLRRRQEAKASDLPPLVTANRRRAIVPNNLDGSKTELLPRPQTPFVNSESRRRRSDNVGLTRHDFAPNNTPTYATDKPTNVTGAFGDKAGSLQDGVLRRARTDPRFDAHVTTYAPDVFTNVTVAEIDEDDVRCRTTPDSRLDGHLTMLNRRRNSEGIRRIITRAGALEPSASCRAASARSQERPPSRSHDALLNDSKSEPDSRCTTAPNTGSFQLDIPNITVSVDGASTHGIAIDGSQTDLKRHEPSGPRPQESENQWKMKDEPEYIESFQHFNVLKPGRLTGENARELKRKLEERKRSPAAEPKERLFRPPVRFSAWDADHGGQLAQETDRCPNCHEQLVRVPSRYIAVRQDERNFFSWIFSKWKNVSTVCLGQ
ncbi:hypothetical protein Btru_002334 [Bulinus truncatus]|nr:hypothetical protein Btru_002334 [Bulinus truncatus]